MVSEVYKSVSAIPCSPTLTDREWREKVEGDTREWRDNLPEHIAMVAILSGLQLRLDSLPLSNALSDKAKIEQWIVIKELARYAYKIIRDDCKNIDANCGSGATAKAMDYHNGVATEMERKISRLDVGTTPQPAPGN